jgi:hypothetical protein
LLDDLQNLAEALFRLAVRLGGFAIACALLYQAYQAGRSALMGINTNGSAPVPDPKSFSSRFGAAAWSLIALAIAAVAFSMIFGF